MMVNDTDLYAYALGYYHGRQKGVYEGFEHGTSQMQSLYRMGYDSGVADYCHEIDRDPGSRA